MSHASAAMPSQSLKGIDGTTLGLYVATVFLWGVSWIGIRAQLGVVAPEMSVLWRFLLAAALMWVWVLATGHRVRFPLADHLRFMAVGCCLFSFNFISFYYGGLSVPSGLLSVVFSLASVFNLALGFLVFRQKVEPRVALGGGDRRCRNRVSVLAGDHRRGLQRGGAERAWGFA